MFGVAGFIGGRPGGRRVLSGSLIGGCPGVPGIHWDTPWGSSASFGVAGFIGVRHG